MRSYLEEMKRLVDKHGLTYPTAVRVDPSLPGKTPMRNVKGELHVNPRHWALSGSQVDRDTGNALGHPASYQTTASKYHLVRHEMMHFSHTTLPTAQDVQEFAALADFRRMYGKRLGLGYAFEQTDSAKLCREFVAEIGAGLLDGKAYDDTVMDWYRRLGGPAI